MDQTAELCHRLIIDCGNRTHFFTFFVILARTDLIDADGVDLVGGSARMIDDRNQKRAANVLSIPSGLPASTQSHRGVR